MYWLNIEFADGTETDYRESAHFVNRNEAIEQAKRHSSEYQLRIYVIDPFAQVVAIFDCGHQRMQR